MVSDDARNQIATITKGNLAVIGRSVIGMDVVFDAGTMAGFGATRGFRARQRCGTRSNTLVVVSVGYARKSLVVIWKNAGDLKPIVQNGLQRLVDSRRTWNLTKSCKGDEHAAFWSSQKCQIKLWRERLNSLEAKSTTSCCDPKKLTIQFDGLNKDLKTLRRVDLPEYLRLSDV